MLCTVGQHLERARQKKKRGSKQIQKQIGTERLIQDPITDRVSGIVWKTRPRLTKLIGEVP